MLCIGLIGCGAWGPNLARNFHAHDRAWLKTVCDLDKNRTDAVCKRMRGVRAVQQYQDLLADEEIHAVVVATPLSSHYGIARDALESGKSVLLEKPLTTDYKTSLELTQLAREQGKILMTGYVFLFNPGIRTIREKLLSGALGELQYIHALRTNLGPVRIDTNALWDLASHDVSIMLHCLNDTPVSAHGVGGYFTGNPQADTVSAGVTFQNGKMGFIYASWMDPRKTRQIAFVGKDKMMLFDDMAPTEMVRIYDKGLSQLDYYDTYGAHAMGVRSGDIVLPSIAPSEPLKEECDAFVRACLDNATNPAIGDLPVTAAAVLETVQRSIDSGGSTLPVVM
jgi:predicted dehydrogenase